MSFNFSVHDNSFLRSILIRLLFLSSSIQERKRERERADKRVREVERLYICMYICMYIYKEKIEIHNVVGAAYDFKDSLPTRKKKKENAYRKKERMIERKDTSSVAGSGPD